MSCPGEVRRMDRGPSLEVDADWLGALLLRDGSPEGVLGELLDLWVREGWVRWGVFFARREGGWARLVARGEDALDRSLLRGVIRSSGTAPACDDVGVHCFDRCGERVGYLILRCPPGVKRGLPTHVRGALTLYLAALAPGDVGELVALRETLCETLVQRHSSEVAVGANDFPGIVGESAAIRSSLAMVQQVADTDASVLVHGESGTGKELFARLLHDRGGRCRGPFISENCAAFSPTLLEAEIFGSEKGAYTGADQTRPGLLERADGGTLFLDEVAEMDLSLQRKLLRVLQERKVRRVGGSELLPVNFRLITATHRDLNEEVAAGRFREDLLYRIVVIRIPVPPLRDRRDDIPLLVRHFLREFARQRGVPAPLVDPEALQVLRGHRWAGNVRELRNEIERAFTLSPARIRVDSLSDRFAEPYLNSYVARQVRKEVGADIRDLERVVIGGVIRDVLNETKWNKTQAAAILGLPKTTFYRRLRHYGIHDDDEIREGARQQP